MSDIKGVNIRQFASQAGKENGAGQVHESMNKDTAGKSGVNTVSQVNRLIIEMHLKITIEAREHVITQAGITRLSVPGGGDLSAFSYNGRPVTEISQDEAEALISEDGLFGVRNTARRIFTFTVKMAGDDPDRLQIARDAALKGFKEAENIFGGTLPGISHETINRVLEMLDEKIRGLGGSVLDLKA